MLQAFSPILDLTKTANTYGLDQNCYYCSVAALSNKTVKEFFNISEIMQQDTATPDEIIKLWNEGGVHNVAHTVFVDDRDFYRQVTETMPRNAGLGLAYTRQNGSGHMVVLAKDNDGIVKCIDYQQNPPKVVNFPPERDIVRVHVFYRTP